MGNNSIGVFVLYIFIQCLSEGTMVLEAKKSFTFVNGKKKQSKKNLRHTKISKKF